MIITQLSWLMCSQNKFCVGNHHIKASIQVAVFFYVISHKYNNMILKIFKRFRPHIQTTHPNHFLKTPWHILWKQWPSNFFLPRINKFSIETGCSDRHIKGLQTKNYNFEMCEEDPKTQKISRGPKNKKSIVGYFKYTLYSFLSENLWHENHNPWT